MPAGMPAGMTAAVLVACAILLSVAIAIVIGRAFIGSLWNALANAHEATEPDAGAVRKNFQTFAIGPVNLGFCVHVAVDEQFLHLLPSRFLKLCGAKPMSVPWEAITMKKKGKRTSIVMIGRQAVIGPTWCLGIADPGDASSQPK